MMTPAAVSHPAATMLFATGLNGVGGAIIATTTPGGAA
jgi:hypothetical protein